MSWPHTGTGLAVIGHPIGHSLSPQMHNAALAAMAQADARFAGWRYHAFDIDPGDLPAALDQMGARGFRGVNLTVPHKVLAVGLVSGLDAGAREAGAVNTLLRSGSGWSGFNTDGYGLATSLRDHQSALTVVSSAAVRSTAISHRPSVRPPVAEFVRIRCSSTSG